MQRTFEAYWRVIESSFQAFSAYVAGRRKPLNADPLGGVMGKWIAVLAASVFAYGAISTLWRTSQVWRGLSPSTPARFRQTGGAHIGGWNATFPFASLIATPAQLTIVCFGKAYVFDQPSVQSLSRYRRLWSEGLRIEHSSPSAPHLVVFWSFDLSKLLAHLDELGWRVSR